MLYFIASWHLFVFLSVYCPAHLYSSSAPFSSKETAFSYDVYVNGIWHSEGLCYQGMQFNFVQVRKCAGNLWVCWKLLEQIVYKTTKQTDVSILHRALQLDTGRYSPMHSHICVLKRQNQNQLQTWRYSRNSRKLLQGAWALTTCSGINIRQLTWLFTLPDPPVPS